MMGKNEKTPITVNEQGYFLEDFDDREGTLYNHIQDLDRKISNAQFNIDQLNLGRVKAVELLAQSLEGKNEQAEEAETLN